MTIDSIGNVGVGTTTPTEKLDVAGKIKATDLNVSNSISSDSFSTTGSIGIGNAPVADAKPAINGTIKATKEYEKK